MDTPSGFSSLSYLAPLHQVIKMDRSFVGPLREGTRNDALLEEIINLGQRMGSTVLAEGIETESLFARLRKMSCELGQGYLSSPTIPAKDVARLLSGEMEASSAWSVEN